MRIAGVVIVAVLACSGCASTSRSSSSSTPSSSIARSSSNAGVDAPTTTGISSNCASPDARTVVDRFLAIATEGRSDATCLADGSALPGALQLLDQPIEYDKIVPRDPANVSADIRPTNEDQIVFDVPFPPINDIFTSHGQPAHQCGVLIELTRRADGNFRVAAMVSYCSS